MSTKQLNPQNEAAMPSFFCTIASCESHPLPRPEELVRIIKHDATVAAYTAEYRQRQLISATLARQVKLKMPGITASALMDGAGKELRNVLKPTYLIATDIDKVPEERMAELTARADADPHTMMRYITASGRGLRILSRYAPCDDDEVTVLELFDVMVRKAMGHYSRLLGVPADEACCDITRMCGLSHDPTVFVRWDSLPFELDARDLKTLYTRKATEAKYAKREAKRRGRKSTGKASATASVTVPTMDEAAPHIEQLLEQWGYRFESGRHNEYVLHFAKVCVCYGIPHEEAAQYAATHYGADYPEYDAVLRSCYKKLHLLGTWHFYRKGEGYPQKPTAKAIKQWLSMRYDLHHNEVTGCYEVRSRKAGGRFARWTRIDDNIENSIWCRMDEDGFQVPPVKLHAIVNSDFSEPWDPFEEYLRGLPRWDGATDYIDQLADRVRVNYCPGYHHSQEEFRYYFKKWLVSMVVGWVSPRVVSQTILVFIGRGGINKTTFFHFLLPPALRQYFLNDSTANYTDKDSMEAFCSKALICYDEFEMTVGKNQSAFKSNLTKLVFSFRRPYDKYRSEMLHRAALCGTSNTLQIIDEDENRRYSPWYVESIVSPRDVPVDYANVYAQAVALGKEVSRRTQHRKGEWVYWLTEDDIQKMSHHNRLFKATNFLEEQILRYYRVPEPDTEVRFVKFRFSAEIMERIGGSPVLTRNLAHQNLSAVMLRLGFKKVHRSNGNGWLVIEKEQSEINNDSFYLPHECQETF